MCVFLFSYYNLQFTAKTHRLGKRTHLTTGKKSAAYCTARIVCRLKEDQHTLTDYELDISLDSISSMSGDERDKICVQFVSTGTQTGVGKKNATTSTGSSMKYVKEVSTQTNLDANNDNDTLHFRGWTEFCSKLKDANQIGRFQNLITAVGSEKLKTTNLAWKSCLDMGVLSNLKFTTSVRYDRDCVEFFSLFYIMFGGSAVNILRGTAHFGSLVEKDTYHGHYDPLKGSFNFPIPSLNTLHKIANGYPKNIDVGFIGQS